MWSNAPGHCEINLGTRRVRFRIFPRAAATLVDSCFDDSSEVAIGPGRGRLSVVKEDGFDGLLDVPEEAFWVTPHRFALGFRSTDFRKYGFLIAVSSTRSTSRLKRDWRSSLRSM